MCTVEYARNVRAGEIGIARDVTNVSMAHRFPARNVAQGNLRLGKRLLGDKKEERELWGLDYRHFVEVEIERAIPSREFLRYLLCRCIAISFGVGTYVYVVLCVPRHEESLI